MYEFSMTEEQELLLESLEEFMDRGNYLEYFKECDHEHKYPEKACNDYIEAGYHLLPLPEEYGGDELDLVSNVLMTMKMYELGWPALALPGSFLQVDNILAYGNKEQQDKVIGEAVAGRKGYTLGFTEPQAGSDNSAMATRAVHKDGKVILNGCKTFNTGASVTKYMMCMAREYENENPYKDMSWYLVPLDAPGVKITPIPKVGCHCIPTCEVRLDDVELDEGALVGKKCMGFYQLMKNFETERLMSCAVNVGEAKCAYNLAAAYAGQRVQFGDIIGKKQIIQEKVCDMRIKILAMENFTLNCAWRKMKGENMGVDISLLKRYTGKAAFEVIDDAMQIMGGIGYTQDCIIDRLWRDQRGFRIFAGSEEIMVHSSARQLIKEAASRKK
ncbi:MAG: acyl-CoA dehydrogenase family protein [Oscillospiraceae bacterium]|nr:acyl-CoA dehydrogenase family protein [Oscillospiraceae bacterium]